MPTTKTTKTSRPKHRQPFEKLRSKLAHPDAGLDWHYQVGTLVLQLVPESPLSEQYGKARILELRDKLGLPKHREMFLYAVREFAAQFKPADLKTLEDLSWSHVHFLLGVRNQHQRRELVKACQREQLSCLALRLRIFEQRPKLSKKGRRPADPKPLGPKAALKETVRLSNQWVDCCSFWLDEIGRDLKNASRRKSDTQFAELIAEAEAALGKLHSEVGKRRRALRSLLRKGR